MKLAILDDAGFCFEHDGNAASDGIGQFGFIADQLLGVLVIS